MQFTQDVAPRLGDSSITLTFRGWTWAQATVGGRYRRWGLLLEVDDIRLIAASEITQRPIWRVRFHDVGLDDQIERRTTLLDEERRSELQRRLERFDRASASGPWTVDRGPPRRSASSPTTPEWSRRALARRINVDRPAFKLSVRKLKELDLTESLDVGYRLSPLGRAFIGIGIATGEEPDAL